MTKVYATNHDTHKPIADFGLVAKYTALGRGSPSNALLIAREHRANDRVLSILQKAAVDPGLISSPTWGANLTEFDGLARAFIDSLRNVGAFDQLLPSMRRVPLNTAAAIVSVGTNGDAALEGDWKPIDALEIGTSGQLSPRKAVAAIVVSNDLLRSVSAEAQALLRRKLQHAVAHVTDAEFISAVTNGIAPGTSLGNVSVVEDLQIMLSEVAIGQGSKLFLLARSPTVKAIAMTFGADDRPQFPDMRVDGGTIAGITVVPSDAVGAGEMVLIDGSGIAASSGTVTLSQASHATMRISSTPGSDETLTSLFQKNLVGFKCERWLGVQRLRDDAVAVMDGVNYANETV